MTNQILPTIGRVLSYVSGIPQGVNQVKNTIDAVSNPVSTVENNLPTIGGVLGGIGGALIPGPDLSGIPEIAGAGIGSSLGEGIKEKLQNQNLSLPNIATSGALGAAGQGIGMGVGKLGEMGTNAVGQGVSNYGDNLITKNLNLTPKMEYDVSKDMGESSLKDFLKKRGLQGADYEKVSTYTEPVQKKFDTIAKNPNIKINPSDVVQNFSNHINDLKNSILPSDQTKANTLQQIALNFIDQYGHMPQIGADILTKLRLLVDKGVKDFGSDPVVASTGNLTRNVLQKSIRDADTTGSLGPLGDELHKLYTLTEKTEPRQFAGQPKSAFPLGGKDAIAGFLGNIFGGPMGATGAIALEKGLGTATGTNVMSNVAQGVGGALQGVSKILPTVGGAVGTIAGNSISPSSTQNTYSQYSNNGKNHNLNPSTNPEQNPPEILNDPARNKTTGHWSTPTDLKPIAVPGDSTMTQNQYATQRAQLVNYPDSANALDQIWTNIKQTRQAWLDKHTPDGLADFISNYKVDRSNMNDLRDILVKYKGATGIQNLNDLVKYMEARNDPQVAVAQAMMNQEQAQQTHETLGRVTQFDIGYLRNIPKPDDTLNAALAKIDKYQSTAAKQYRQYAPIYNYSVANGNSNSNPITAGQITPTQTPSQQLPPITSTVPTGFKWWGQ